ncbi:MFS transporter [Verrucomicrobium sp. BvORR106]|uniref:MFS transporter n=1 Tax=Verrucomicrobium sp. BvORR106 TaxID=1403819 RepID=UPI00056ED06A|nr:MFS transporter [Verrucomicrobium sp. BvORR106]
MSHSSSPARPVDSSAGDAASVSPARLGTLAAWGNVVLAALLMLATLPGRTQGLGLITEPLLKDLALDRVAYANINLWATLLGSAFCLPAGWLIDRCGLRWTTAAILLLLAGVVWQMSVLAGGITVLFILVLLTRALGQSALSVASISTVGKSFGLKAEWAMAVYSVLLSIFFIAAFVWVGGVVESRGWRVAWGQLIPGLLVAAGAVVFLLREPGAGGGKTEAASPAEGFTLGQASRTQTFWVFAGATAMFGLVSSGFGLFNESILAERGFDQKTFHDTLAITTLFALLGQMLCGWLSLRRRLARLLAVALLLYAGGLGALPLMTTLNQLWAFAAIFGVTAGFITVIFFAIWGRAFGRAHLGRIQGAAQMLTVFASAIGPLVFARSHAAVGSYGPLLFSLAPLLLLVAGIAWFTRLPGEAPTSSPA